MTTETPNYNANFPSIKDQVSPEEWAARVAEEEQKEFKAHQLISKKSKRSILFLLFQHFRFVQTSKILN